MWKCPDEPNIEWYSDKEGELDQLMEMNQQADKLLKAAIGLA